MPSSTKLPEISFISHSPSQWENSCIWTLLKQRGSWCTKGWRDLAKLRKCQPNFGWLLWCSDLFSLLVVWLLKQQLGDRRRVSTWFCSAVLSQTPIRPTQARTPAHTQREIFHILLQLLEVTPTPIYQSTCESSQCLRLQLVRFFFIYVLSNHKC